jgi:hypothetical protein
MVEAHDDGTTTVKPDRVSFLRRLRRRDAEWAIDHLIAHHGGARRDGAPTWREVPSTYVLRR